MSHIQFVDELVREYLLFRGFVGSLKSFDQELKQDKDKGFRVSFIPLVNMALVNYTIKLYCSKFLIPQQNLLWNYWTLNPHNVSRR